MSFSSPDIDLNDPEVQKAATKIQAGFRGHKARKEVKETAHPTEPNAEDEEIAAIDLTDPGKPRQVYACPGEPLIKVTLPGDKKLW